MPKKLKPTAERFWEKVNKTTDTGCWEWTGGIVGFGYGGFATHFAGEGRKSNRAHRFAWQLINGPIPDGLWVLHKCDNRICVNPDHLFLGDRRDNMLDCAAKGRNTKIGWKNSPICKNGHLYPANPQISDKGCRVCPLCHEGRNAKRRTSDLENRDSINAKRRGAYVPIAVRENRNPTLVSNNTSGYRGVSYHKTNKAWKASIRHQGKPMHIGYFKSAEEAALAYNEKAMALLGDLAKLNKIRSMNK